MIRIGFIGCGGIAHEYLSRLDAFPDRARLVAFCDVDLGRAEALAAERGARAYVDWRRMLDEGGLDALFVNLPPFAREDELEEATRRGLHIFTTKPLGLSLDGPRRSLEAIEVAGVVAQVGYMFRYSGITERARELLGGRPVALVLGQVMGSMPGGWVAQGALSGGQIVEQSTHLVDAARYLAGDVETAFARASTGHAADRVDYPDSTALTLTHIGGAVTTVLSTAAVWQFFWGLTVVARDLHLDLVYDQWTIKGTVDGQAIYEHIPVSGYPEQVEGFLDAVEVGDPSRVRSTYRDAFNTLAATLAATRSLETGAVEQVEKV